MPSFLEGMASASRERVRLARSREKESVLRRRALATALPPGLSLERFDVIAEVKLRSPAAGRLADPGAADAAVVNQSAAYEAGGAAAISVLTEPAAFDGASAHLAAAARAVSVPVLRKDFLVEPYQVLEARAWGAGGVLLIARLLGERQLDEMLDAACEMSLFALVEAFDAEDLARIGDVASPGKRTARVLVGLNSRDLVSLSVEPHRHEELAAAFPQGSTRVAESGIETPDDAARAAALGYHLALVGSALMQANEPGRLVASMIGAGRDAVERSRCASA
jgi:indole-3-glycerol phosphate synthase